jgi:hypothetical protein
MWKMTETVGYGRQRIKMHYEVEVWGWEKFEHK